MRAVFNFITTLSLRLWPLTVALSLAVIGGGVYAFTQFNQELLPDIAFPQTFVVMQDGGATSDQILTMYAIPIEERAQEVDDVVNVETTSNQGFGFAIIRNEFGVDQDRVVNELEDQFDQITLPTRRITPPEGMDAEALIGELSPEAVLWLYDWANRENSGFIPQLDSEVLRAFSEDALAVLPESAFNDLPRQLRDDVQPDTLREIDVPETAPELPDSWQGDPRFQTTEDIVELTTTRRLATLFNDLIENGELVGPLGTVSDLTTEDVQFFLASAEDCRALDRPEATDSEDRCSFIAALTAEEILAMDGELIALLPDNYVQQLGSIERSNVAAVRIAEALTGETFEAEDVLLPDSWRVSKPSIITFNFSDIPLGQISIDSDTMSSEELRDFVENDLAPRLREVENVASVSIDGGEIIPIPIQNAAREEIGLPPLGESQIGDSIVEETQEATSEGETDGDATDEAAAESEDTAEDDAPADEPETDDDASMQNQQTEYPEGPALPPVWGAVADIAGTDEFDTADDIFLVVGSDIQGVEINSAADFINALGEQATAAPLLDSLNQEILDYLAEQEPGFYDNLDDNIAERFLSPSLGDAWQRLSGNELLSDMPLTNVAELQAAGPVETIATIMEATQQDGLRTFAIQLMNDISPEALNALVAENENFVSELAEASPDALRFMSAETLSTQPVMDFIASTDNRELASELEAIASGEQLSVAEARLETEGDETFEDPNAPPLAPSWAGVAPFVGASELDTTDDLFNVPGYPDVASLINSFALGQGSNVVRDLTAENWLYIAEQEENFWQNVSATALTLINAEEVDISQFPNNVQATIEAGETYEPEATVTRTNFNPSFLMTIFKDDEANTIETWDDVNAVLQDFNAQDDVSVNEVFEQATFITDSLEGVQREGGTGAIMAVVIILIFMNLSFRSTAVVSVSIPASVMFAFILMSILPGQMNALLTPVLEDVGRDTALGSILVVIIRLFPESITLNIMTLSGLTVAIGRVVDDSIVVLENIYRNIGLIPPGEETAALKQEAVLTGTREVSLAIFSATLSTMVVFLPLGLFGGITGAFFLPFGLAVTYALIGSYIASITIVPVLAYLFISRDSMPEEGLIPIKEEMPATERTWARISNVFIGSILWLGEKYSILIRMVLATLVNRLAFIAGAIALLVFGLFLLANRPVQFLPDFGEPTISVTVALPSEVEGQPVGIAFTNAKVNEFENYLLQLRDDNPEITNVQVTIGGTGDGDFGGGGTGNVTETAASITIGVTNAEALEEFTPIIREEAENIFDDLDNDGQLDYAENGESPDVVASNVTVSGSGLQGGGFGGFSLVLQGADGDNQPSLSELAEYNDVVLSSLAEVDGLVNVELESNFSGSDGATYIRIDGVPALRYTGEVEADDTIGVTQQAVTEAQEAIDDLRAERDDLTAPVEIGQGFESQEQEEGIQDIVVSMGIATLIAYSILVLTFGNIIWPLEILVSLPLAIVGAAVALTVTDRVLGLPAMVGFLLLIGIVLTNAIVFLDRVKQNTRERNMRTYDALVEAGRTRLRPILMTATTTTIAQLPLAASTESGAIIAAELGTVVIGGLVSSTILTLLLLPVIHSLVDGGLSALANAVGLGNRRQNTASSTSASD